ncbi:MAG: threonine--tRNA ligase [Deltaproteobacteria bacterium]|nr:threonine--tRNA ligase [Deltaproteobacteria bacterium]MBW2384757.1 threonine--tRNA ligase [Deltaproteobacteria bacterium]
MSNQITVSLPDGKTLSMEDGSTVLAVAERIGPGLAKATLAGRVDGKLVDLRTPLRTDCGIEIVTARDPEGGNVIRHSAEHVMADAVKRLFPDAQIDAGRADHSEKFQYDFLVDRPFTPEDLERIEKEMQSIIAEKAPFERRVVDREEARALFRGLDEELKLSRLDDIPDGEEITVFQHGDFVDLCRGPHVQRSDQIGAATLLEVSGTYFRGDERGPKLQRIYGTAFSSKKELKAYLARIEEARKRDHRRVGVALGLFQLDPAISPGSPFYLPKGVALYNGLVEFIRELYPKYGFEEILTPQLFRSELFKRSGHHDKFYDDMYWFAGADEDEELGMKAMNCPGHCHLFEIGKRSYRELPIRWAEFSRLHRNERSGTLTGLTRVRSFAQDDAHIYCEPDQVPGEVDAFFRMVREVYDKLGLEGVEMAVSTRSAEFLGEPEDWDVAEKVLIEAVERAGFVCRIKEGEAAFYAPKVEADFRDVLGRAWTLGTVQIDMAMPGRFGLRYVGRDGELHQPAMLHRAVLGSLERFIAIYIEHTGGDFPFWLAPVQVIVLPISEKQSEYARAVQGRLRDQRLRVGIDERSETLNWKIREAERQKIPLSLVVGEQEASNGTVSPRLRRSKDKIPVMAMDALTAMLVAASTERKMGPLE